MLEYGTGSWSGCRKLGWDISTSECYEYSANFTLIILSSGQPIPLVYLLVYHLVVHVYLSQIPLYFW